MVTQELGRLSASRACRGEWEQGGRLSCLPRVRGCSPNNPGVSELNSELEEQTREAQDCCPKPKGCPRTGVTGAGPLILLHSKARLLPFPGDALPPDVSGARQFPVGLRPSASPKRIASVHFRSLGVFPGGVGEFPRFSAGSMVPFTALPLRQKDKDVLETQKFEQSLGPATACLCDCSLPHSGSISPSVKGQVLETRGP